MSVIFNPSSIVPLPLFLVDAVSLNEAEVDSSGNGEFKFDLSPCSEAEDVLLKRAFLPPVFSFPSLVNEESLIGVSKPLPKQLWEAKKVRAYTSVTPSLFCTHSRWEQISF